jgi:hypothetical protein
MSDGLDVPRVLLAALAASILIYRFSSQALALHAAGRQPAVVIRNAAAFLAIVGLVWILVCLVADVPARFEWPGLVLAATASTTYLAVFTVGRHSAARVLPMTSPHRAEERTVPKSRLDEWRMLALMVFILGASGTLGAMLIRLWLVVLPFLLLVVGAWAALVVMFFRS